jgi:hypothetical protein
LIKFCVHEDAGNWKIILEKHGLQDLIHKFEEEELNIPERWKYVKPEDLTKMGLKIKHLVGWRKFYDEELKNSHEVILAKDDFFLFLNIISIQKMRFPFVP